MTFNVPPPPDEFIGEPEEPEELMAGDEQALPEDEPTSEEPEQALQAADEPGDEPGEPDASEADETSDEDDPGEAEEEEASSDAEETTGAAGEAASTSSLKPLKDEPFNWDEITITLVVQWLPSDGDPNGRRVTIGVRNSADTPILRELRESELGDLPTSIQELLTKLRNSLPTRQLQALKAQAKKTPRRKPAATTTPSPAQMLPGTEAVKAVTPPAKPVAAPNPAPAPTKPKPTSSSGQISMF